MEIVTQFHSSELPPAELNRIIAEYLAVERLRVFRRLLVKRCGLLALAVLIVGVAFRRISLTATTCSVAIFVLLPGWAWLLETRRNRALARRLERIPGGLHSAIRGTLRKS